MLWLYYNGSIFKINPSFVLNLFKILILSVKKGGRYSDDSFFVVIFSVLLGELNKAHSRMSSLSLEREYIGFVPCVALKGF